MKRFRVVVLVAAIVNIILIIALLVYLPKLSRRSDSEIRDELRNSRTETQTQTGQFRKELNSNSTP